MRGTYLDFRNAETEKIPLKGFSMLWEEEEEKNKTRLKKTQVINYEC